MPALSSSNHTHTHTQTHTHTHTDTHAPARAPAHTLEGDDVSFFDNLYLSKKHAEDVCVCGGLFNISQLNVLVRSCV